ncbi:MAG TPA: DUF2970 domain-containing protein [Rubrivivax sp.]|nr:DUF2970 domain-containing protein [Rubrivivax sp.]
MKAAATTMGGELKQAIRRRGSFLQTLRAVGWSFFGVRRGADHEQDVAQLNPLHVVVVGVVLAALFVVGLLWLVGWVVGSGMIGA